MAKFGIEYLLWQSASLAGLVVAFVTLGIVVGRPWRLRTRPISADLTFFYTQDLFSKSAVLLGIGIVFRLSGSAAGGDPATGVAAWPLWIQIAAVYAAWEFVIYWQHRLLHRPPLWRVHAVHHSSTELDWLSTYRMHPVEVMFYMTALPLLLWIGFSAQCFVWISWFRLCHNSFVHADLPWTLGPLRYVIVSPVFHRWHHEVSADSSGRNFASGLCLYDLLFGTYYFPADRLPGSFGISDEVPAGFVRQVAYPFRRPRDAAAPSIA